MSTEPPFGAKWFRRAELLAVGALFGGILGFELIASDPLSVWGVLYVVPVLIVARRMGRNGGLAAAGLASLLMVASAQARNLDVDVVVYLVRAGMFLTVGLLGATGDRRGAGGGNVSTVLNPHSPVDGSPPSTVEVRRREALELGRVATWELDLSTGVMQWSDEYQVLYGVDPRVPLTSRSAFQQIIHPDDREIFLGALEQVIADGTTLEVRYRITRPDDGAQCILRSHIRAQDEAGEKRQVIGTAQDVTHLAMVLTPRESEMLMLLADGLSGEEIAERLVLSPATVRTHVQNAMVKLGSHTRGQAIAAALRTGEIGS